MHKNGFNFDNTYLELPEVFYTQLNPVSVSSPKMVILNHDLATSLGLDFSELGENDQASLFAGNTLPEESTPFAQAYAGHQFGHFTMLGDGRAHILGEQITPEAKRFDIQFKGSGRTPYSRGGDGRAVLGPMLREYLISEAMHGLAIPTTRSLAVVTTGEDVIRETHLPGAILTRVAASHIRIGTFEFAASQRNASLVEALLDYTIDRHDPGSKDAENKALAFLHSVIDRQSDLIVHWMRVGFIHGVMNTDNMALSGETIDYGPCAFMDWYDPDTVFSSIDHNGRYAYSNQPLIANWNIARLAEALLPLIHEDIEKAIEIAKETVNGFSDVYKKKWLSMMRAKLGLSGKQMEDEMLITDLLDWMQKNQADYTNTFRDLSQEHKPTESIYECVEFETWYERWRARQMKNSKPLSSSTNMMKSTNPAIIPRNHIVEEALEAAQAGDFTRFHDFHAILKEPYKDDETIKPYQTPPAPGERVHQTFCGT